MKLPMHTAEKDRELERYKIDHAPSQPPAGLHVGAHSEQFRLVPKFDEMHVTEFFQRFEKIAIGFKWPRERWAVLAQSVFVGKALRAFDSLSVPVKDSFNYDVLKSIVPFEESMN